MLVTSAGQAQHAADHGDLIILYGDTGFGGDQVELRGSVQNLQAVPANGFDGTANDFAFSIRAKGRWSVCMDAGFATRCRLIEGDVADLGEDNGSISSIRYVGPSTTAAMTASAAAPAPHSAALSPTSPSSAPPSAPPISYTPLYNTDMFGNDIRAIVYERPGSTWQMCKAECDADGACEAWTYVVPGRTEHGECFLKSPVPETSQSDCCVSGVKESR